MHGLPVSVKVPDLEAAFAAKNIYTNQIETMPITFEDSDFECAPLFPLDDSFSVGLPSRNNTHA